MNDEDILRRQDDSVFVDIVEVIQGDQILIPSRIRSKIFNYRNNIRSGEVYLSLFDERPKCGEIVGEWELDEFGTRRVVRRNEFPNDVIERSSEVVRGVADDQAENVW